MSSGDPRAILSRESTLLSSPSPDLTADLALDAPSDCIYSLACELEGWQPSRVCQGAREAVGERAGVRVDVARGPGVAVAR